jgi:uncharacterized damage-inducible protein DinB
LQACASLSTEQFHQVFEIGPGSLHNTTTHIMGAMRGWTDTLLGTPDARHRLEKDGKQRTVPDLMALLDEVAGEFERVARAYPLDGVMTAVRAGVSYEFPRGTIITHVLTHGTHHRAQGLNMLRRLGVSPLPLSSVLEWIRTTHPKA